MVKETESYFIPKWEPSVDDVKQLRPQLYEPRYPLKVLKHLDLRLTYRKLNSWERSGLISPHRMTEKTGWRKFSFAQAVLLLMICDLKSFGLAIDVIHRVLAQLAPPPSGVSVLELFLVSSIRGGRYVFLLDREGSITTPTNYEGILHTARSGGSCGPMVLCPLYDYVCRVLRLTETEVTSTKSPEPRQLSSQEEELLSIIANQDYEKIEITKSDGKAKTVKAVKWKKGKLSADDVMLSLNAGDFLEVTATKKNGKIVTIKSTDNYKL